MHTTWTSPMCCSVASDSFRRGQRPVSQKKQQFHDLPRASRSHQTQNSFLKTHRNNAVLFHGHPLDHLAHDRVFGSVYFVVAQFGPGLQHQVNCDFCPAPVFCKLLFSLIFEMFTSAFLCFCLFPPDQCTLLRNAFEVNSSSHSSLSSVNCPFTFCQRLSFGLFSLVASSISLGALLWLSWPDS